MLTFNQFINESRDQIIEVDPKMLESNKDSINAELDLFADKPFQNAPILLAKLRGCLERYGILLPAAATVNFLNLSAELVYMFEASDDLHLYVVYDTRDDGFVDAYAQIVDTEELDTLFGEDKDAILSYHDPETAKGRESTWYRKRDDDAGNSDEY